MKFTFALIMGLACLSFAANQKFNFIDGTGKVIGHGTLEDTKGGVKVALDLMGVQPGTHGIHLHSVGKCEGPKFETAGGHLNPDHKKHGHQSAEGPHLGDLGNIEVPANGNLKKEVELKNVTLKPGMPNTLMTADGTSMVIHAKADDEKTDPSGAAGDRVYCGVISTGTATAKPATY
jgi:Cu-Zn family superoxide dismutase